MESIGLLLDIPLIGLTIAVAAGAVIGSFLNVVIHRLPLMMHKEWAEQCDELRGDPVMKTLPRENITLAAPPSRCPCCGAPIRPLHNVPIIGYLWLRGKCAHCKAVISPRYLIVEAACASLGVYLFYRFGLSMQFLFYALFTFLLVPLVFIDLKHKLLPDSIVYLVLWSGVLFALVGRDVALNESVLGVMAGYLSLWSVYVAFKFFTGKEGMGHGDFKLLAAIGAWTGWQSLLTVIIISSVAGTAAGLILLYINKDKPNASRAYPFGPYLAAAGWITLMWDEDLARLSRIGLF